MKKKGEINGHCEKTLVGYNSKVGERHGMAGHGEMDNHHPSTHYGSLNIMYGSLKTSNSVLLYNHDIK